MCHSDRAKDEQAGGQASQRLVFAVFFTHAEWRTLRALGADHRHFDALFRLDEAERLCFLRRLYHQGRLRP